jgi:hypothetical protein
LIILLFSDLLKYGKLLGLVHAWLMLACLLDWLKGRLDRLIDITEII